MVKSPQNWSIRHKLLAIILTFLSAYLCFLVGGIVIYEIATYFSRMKAEVNDLGWFIAVNSAPSLAFNDPQTAREILNTLASQPEIEAAALYRPNGALFAAYVRKNEKDIVLPSSPGPEGIRRDGMSMDMVKKIRQKGQDLGTLYIHSDIALLHSRLKGYMGFLGVMVLATVGGAFLLQWLLRKMISEPLLSLARSAKRIAAGDLDHRVEEGSGDEFGQLAHAFNQMTSDLQYYYAVLEDSRNKLKIRVAERTAEVEERSRQLQQLALRLSEAEDRERRQIALILHDDLQQYLAAVRFHLQRLIPPEMDLNGIEAHARKLIGLIDESIQKCRSLSHDLSPPVLHQNGLFAALEWLARDMQEKHGQKVYLQLQQEAEPEDPALAVMLYHSIKELVFNSAKHSGVDSVRVEAEKRNGFYRIRVSDRGKGYDSNHRSLKDQGAGFGLFTIEERITYMGGRFDIDCAQGKGFCVMLEIPEQGKSVVEKIENQPPGAPS